MFGGKIVLAVPVAFSSWLQIFSTPGQGMVSTFLTYFLPFHDKISVISAIIIFKALFWRRCKCLCKMKPSWGRVVWRCICCPLPPPLSLVPPLICRRFLTFVGLMTSLWRSLCTNRDKYYNIVDKEWFEKYESERYWLSGFIFVSTYRKNQLVS